MTILDRNPERALLACSGEDADLTLVSGGQSVVSFAFGVDHADDIEEVVSRLKANSVPSTVTRSRIAPATARFSGSACRAATAWSSLSATAAGPPALRT